MGVPIVYYSKGEVQVNEKSIKYIAKKNKMGFARSYTGLKDNLEFELEYTKIKQIEWFKPKYALINYYNIKWIKINYEVSTTEEEILICVGSMGPSMGKIINNTDELYKVIMQLWQNI